MQLPSWWLKKTIISWLLWPLSLLFGVIVKLRWRAYKSGLLSAYHSTLPVIIVGNISVGGTGKTPLVIALVQYLQQQGWQPAVVSRGYKSQCKQFPFLITAQTPVQLAGDEPLLIAQHTHCPVVIDPKRVRAVKLLEKMHNCNIIISDDGLQHYALARDKEIVVMDGKRQFGNHFLLPAGMLREPISRALQADIIVCNGDADWLYAQQPRAFFNMHLQMKALRALSNNQTIKPLSDFKNQTIHAVAGIGHPERFFAMLREQNIIIIPHVFPDHHIFTATDFLFAADKLPIIMTEKDAVKCQGLVYNAWYLEIEAVLPAEFYAQVNMQAITKTT